MVIARSSFSKKRILVIAIVVVGVVVPIVSIYFWQYLNASFAEAEDAMRSFLTSLNSYNAEASWGIMSPKLHSSYGTKEDFDSNILNPLRQSDWHAELTSIRVAEGNFSAGIIPTTARFVVTLQITETSVDVRNETHTFRLAKIEGEWKIDDWLVGT